MASRLLFHLFNPPSFTLLRHNHCKNSLTLIKFCQNFSSGALHENNFVSGGHRMFPSHPWPEWCRFIDMIFAKGHYDCHWASSKFVVEENLPMDFVDVSNLCLHFAADCDTMLSWLSRNDIEVLTKDVYPHLFKSAHESDRRMRSFLQGNRSGPRIATSEDLMKYILTFLSTPVVYPEKSIKEATESSVRSLLYQMANLGLNGYRYKPKLCGPNNTTKRREWICPKCSFMNFARNTKCLKCDETRPQRHLAGEWDCPRCNFFNSRKNTVCLKCESKPPYEVSLTYAPSTETQDKYEEDKTYKWFRKVIELYGVTRPTNR